MYVIKIGGATGNDLVPLVKGLRGLEPFVLVHGGSAAADELSAQLGRSASFRTSPSGFRSRRTDGFALDVVIMAMAGRVNTQLVASLQAAGVKAVGLSGVDGRLLVGRRKGAIRETDGAERVRVIRDDRSGVVEQVNTDLLRGLLSLGYAPVLSPPILDGAEGVPLNADADRIAAKVAGSLVADALVLLTNVPGLLRDPKDPESVIATLPRDDLGAWVRLASGGMKKKLLAAGEALVGGVKQVVIADSRHNDPVRTALAGAGTVIE